MHARADHLDAGAGIIDDPILPSLIGAALVPSLRNRDDASGVRSARWGWLPCGVGRSRPYRRTLPIVPLCDHFESDLRVDPPLDVCSACVEIGGTWVHLRQCLTCGRTGCCDLSPNRHATGHYRETGHSMIRTAEPDEDWRWCYADDRLFPSGLAVHENSAT